LLVRVDLGKVASVEHEDHRRTAAEAFNGCWELLENADEQMIIGDWMISRAAATVGEAHLSLRFAQRAYDRAQELDVPDWLSASVCEGLARAHAANGDLALRNQWYETAGDLIERIEDHESKALIADQLDSVPRAPFAG
jgi:hypothetical protein